MWQQASEPCPARHLSGQRALLLAGVFLIRGVRAPGEFGSWCPNNGIEVRNIVLSPATPHTNSQLQVSVLGRIPSSATAVYAPNVTVEATIWFCRRVMDCMAVFETQRPLCTLLEGSHPSCGSLEPGEAFNASSSWHLPLLMIRGSYNLFVRFRGQDSEVSACYELRGVEVLASRFINVIRDYRDALVAFFIAASSSRAIGIYFPTLSCGVLPQISGFLLMGILLGPYATNLVSRMHILLIGNIINRVALAFIAGAAGAEIFVPELLDLLAPMALQVLFICAFTLLFCGPGLMMLVSNGWLSSPVLDLQPTVWSKGAVALLVSALMTARSPASIIAVVSELKCGTSKAAKMSIGITVLSDIAVLILFSLSARLVHVTRDGGGFSANVLLGVLSELTASAVLGLATGFLLRLVLPPLDHGRMERRCSEEVLTLSNPEKKSRPDDAGNAEEKDPGATEGSQGQWTTAVVALRGALLILILCMAFTIATGAHEWTGGRVRLEPLLACTVASCVCGHDQTRRERLLEALSFWTPHVLLPFFTLAGASLELPGLGQVLPAALALVVLRGLGIAAGSATAGLVANRTFPEAQTSQEAVQSTWLTLIAQAGVTLGLVLEVQRSFGGSWSQHFGTLVIGVVVLNQLLGPVLCRVGLRRIVAAEAHFTGSSVSSSPRFGDKEAESGSEESGSSSEESSRSGIGLGRKRTRRPAALPAPDAILRPPAGLEAYGSLVRPPR